MPHAICDGYVMVCLVLTSYTLVVQDTWTATDANEDVQQNNITHSFASTKNATASEGLEELFRVMQMLLPEELNTFSAAR